MSKNVESESRGTVRFVTGATRSVENTYDPDGFLSPAVLVGFCRYMEKHRVQKDGKLRAGDNWQKGMPTSRAWRSLARHYQDAWLMSRGYPPQSEDCITVEDALHGVLFNVQVILKNRIDQYDHEEPGGSETSGEIWEDKK
jgi:hypothetical protein